MQFFIKIYLPQIFIAVRYGSLLVVCILLCTFLNDNIAYKIRRRKFVISSLSYLGHRVFPQVHLVASPHRLVLPPVCPLSIHRVFPQVHLVASPHRLVLPPVCPLSIHLVFPQVHLVASPHRLVLPPVCPLSIRR
jgi:hypothetical protein